MPIYEYHCKHCEEIFSEFKKIADYKEPAVHTCGTEGTRIISKPMVAVDYPAYVSPASGRVINGRKEHEAELKRTGCRLLEPGETKDFERKQLDKEAKFDKLLDNALGQVLAETKQVKGDLHGR